MTNQLPNFLVHPTSTAPSSLPEAIRQVANLSAGFCRSWISHEIDDALATSGEAFQLLDHIQNELLRHRDEKNKKPGWENSPFQLALDTSVGEILNPATPTDKSFFLSLTPGKGCFPSGASLASLTLETALNKLKHRSTNAVNFIASSDSHTLYIFTNSGMNKKDTISSFNIKMFCEVCKAAAKAI